MTETGLNTKNAEIIQLLTDMNQKFDSLLAALGVPPPTPTATLDDLKELLEDIHADTNSMNQKLLTIRNAIGIVDPVEGDSALPLLALFVTLLDRIGIPISDDTILARLGTIDNTLADIYSSIGIPIGDASTTALGYLSSMQFALSNLNNVLALPNFDGFVIPQYLAAIKLNTSMCQCDPKDPDQTEQCLELLTSSGMVFFPSIEFENVSFSSINAAVWPGPLPYDLEYGTVFGVSADNSSLVPASGYSWEGWRLFVKSTSDNFALQTTNYSRYSTNEWINLEGTAEISVIVDGGATVTAFLCRIDTSGPWEGGPDACAETPLRSASYSLFFYEGPLTPVGGIGFALTIAVFPGTIPDSVEFTSTLDTINNAELSPISSWEGWSIYVESESTTYSTKPDYSNSYTCNQWRTLSGDDPLVFVVNQPYTLTATLCPPDESIEPEECQQSSSFTVDSEPASGYKFRQMVSFTGFTSLTLLNTAELAPGITAVYDADVIHTGDLAGWTVNYVSGTVRVVHGILGTGIAWEYLNSPGQTATLPANTTFVLFDDFVEPNAPGSGAFTVELCPYNP